MASRGRQLSSLAGLVGARLTGGDPVILDVTHDSRQVTTDALYVALRGHNVDGHDFVAVAVGNGAAAVCVDHETGAEVPELVVADTRGVLGSLAAAVHDYPSKTLDVVGVTGTNGKTTVTHYVDSIASGAGRLTGLVGTIHTKIAGSSKPAALTTPEAPDFQRLLARMRDAGVSLAAAEVSSHALELGRVKGTSFAVAAFTNLSQDHLDFHGDMDAYRAAKMRLFTDYEVGTAVVNIDDPSGADIAAGHGGELLTVGSGGDFSIHSLETHSSYSVFTVGTPGGAAHVKAPVIGQFNVSNLVLAAACCVAVGLPYDAVFEGMTEVSGVPGRYEVISGNDPITVIVDYAHTPEGVLTAVETARGLTTGRVIALLGAGGDRDRRKRAAMGEALSRADFAVVTSDNPRSETPAVIVAAVESGMAEGADHIVEVDRHLAIDRAIDLAEDGDVVLILGRGHESHQQVGEQRLPFDDRVVARGSLRRRRNATGRRPLSDTSP